MSTTDREVASCRKGYTPKRNPFAYYQTYLDSSGRRFEYLNGDRMARQWDAAIGKFRLAPHEDRGLPPHEQAFRAKCERCGHGYAELVKASTCICSECIGEDLVAWGIRVQEDLGYYEEDMAGVFLGWHCTTPCFVNQNDSVEGGAREIVLRGRTAYADARQKSALNAVREGEMHFSTGTVEHHPLKR